MKHNNKKVKSIKNKAHDNHLFVVAPIAHAFNFTGSFVFAHMAYHIAKSGNYDPEKCWPSNVKNRTGVSINTYKRYLSAFVDEKILLIVDGKYYFNPDNIIFDDVFTAYKNEFSGGEKQITTVSLIEVDPRDVDEENMTGKQAEHERGILIIEALARDRCAGNASFNKGAPNEHIFKNYTLLVKLFGVDWRTVKSILDKISTVKRSYFVARDEITKAIKFTKTALHCAIFNKKQRKFMKKNADDMKQLVKRFNRPIPT